MERPKHIRREPYTLSAEDRAQSWLTSYGEQFRIALAEVTTRAHRKTISDHDGTVGTVSPDVYNSVTRMLEEMPVCMFWKDWSKSQPLPAGFQIVNGSVLILNPKFMDAMRQSRRVDHAYLVALDDPELIFDHCAAQFYRRKPNPEIKKGERLDELKDLAGDLFTPITTGNVPSHWFLLGRKSTIAERTGMIYDNFGRLG